MKKILFLTVAALFVSISVFAQEQQEQEPEQRQIQIQQTQEQKNSEKSYELQLNFTNFGVGIYMPFSGLQMVEFNFELLNLGIESRATKLGVQFSPFNLYGWVGEGGGSTGEINIGIGGELCFSFLNASVYWNMLSFLDFSESFYVAPYGSISYLFLSLDKFDISKYIVGAGLRGGIRGKSEKVRYNIFTVDTGFRYIEGVPKFYAGIKFDFIMNALKKQGMFS
ncbi:MAG: hypothetical protein LBQ82_02000 [Treponema sp.]|jgi:hypothetical protein|nr:hypothetical protein [Treponema sp.]